MTRTTGRQIAATLRSPAELLAHDLVPATAVSELDKVASRYAVAVTPEVAALMDRNDPEDPIARQYLPDARELLQRRGEHPDPIGDDAHSPVAGIVHRYPDRVLFKLVHVCAVYCRFCFRREMVGPGKETALSPDAYAAALAYIRSHAGIWEVILTGGDPLMLSPRRLAEIMVDLAAIDHVKIIRLHSRVPVADPARISAEMVAALKVAGATTWVALHANHPRELTAAARAACGRIVDAGIPMLSQSVLLRGVNDCAATLEALMRAFVECRIKPYYLHHGDLAPGTAHLRTTLEQGQALVRALRGKVSGLCQPDYVLDIPGGFGKAPVGPAYLSHANSLLDGNASSAEKNTLSAGDSCAAERERPLESRYRITDYCGDVHLYPPEP